MRHILLLIALLLGYNSFCQTIIYSENCGTPSATTVVSTYTGWQNNGKQTYTGNADVRTTVPSSGYTGASGGGNIFITNTAGTNCTISGINTIGYTGVCLQFGILKTANGSNGSNLAVEYSTDGTTWNALNSGVAVNINALATNNVAPQPLYLAGISSTSNILTAQRYNYNPTTQFGLPIFSGNPLVTTSSNFSNTTWTSRLYIKAT